MKIAIVGAGLAGLACANELLKNGVTPDVFEKKDYIGTPLTYAASALKLFESSSKDRLKVLKKKYGIGLAPLYPIEKIIMLSPKKETVIQGDLGHVFLRGMQESSLENQIASISNIQVNFNCNIRLEEIKNQYDHIVIATGNDSIPNKLGLWTTTLNTYTRIATVIGNFYPGTIKIWFDTEYAKNCFCYLTPCTDKEAFLVLIADSATASDVDYYWKEFLIHEEITYTITETMDSEYNLGRASLLKAGNLYFAGTSAGVTDDFLGFGALNAIESGILAARAIITESDYTSLMEPMIREVQQIHEFRKAIRAFDNEDFDRTVAFLDLPGIKKFIYRNPVVKAKHYIPLVRFYNKSK